jgi:hypothetical protein
MPHFVKLDFGYVAGDFFRRQFGSSLLNPTANQRWGNAEYLPNHIVRAFGQAVKNDDHRLHSGDFSICPAIALSKVTTAIFAQITLLIVGKTVFDCIS